MIPFLPYSKVIDHYGNRVDLLIGLKGLDPQAFSRVGSAAREAIRK
jgi:hypothetical protein